MVIIQIIYIHYTVYTYFADCAGFETKCILFYLFLIGEERVAFWNNQAINISDLGPLLLTWFNFNPSMDK